MPTAAEALGQVMSLNRRRIAPIPKAVYQGKQKVHIFNVSWQSWERGLGSLGTYQIPACMENAEYSLGVEVPGVVLEYYDQGNSMLAWNAHEGRDVANEIVGIGRGEGNDLSEWGVFVADGAAPTKEELRQARERLARKCADLVAQADRLALSGNKGLEQINHLHRRAAAHLKQRRAWAQLPEMMIECPGCGEPIPPRTVRHTACGAVIDRHRAWALGMLTAPEVAAMQAADRGEEPPAEAQPDNRPESRQLNPQARSYIARTQGAPPPPIARTQKQGGE